MLVEQSLKLALDLGDPAEILTTGRSISKGHIAELRAEAKKWIAKRRQDK